MSNFNEAVHFYATPSIYVPKRNAYLKILKISLLFHFRGRKQLLFLEVWKKDETRTVQVIHLIKLK